MDRNLTENCVKRGFVALPSAWWRGDTGLPGVTVVEIDGKEYAGRTDDRGRVWCKAIKDLKPQQIWLTRAARRIIIQTRKPDELPAAIAVTPSGDVRVIETVEELKKELAESVTASPVEAQAVQAETAGEDHELQPENPQPAGEAPAASSSSEASSEAEAATPATSSEAEAGNVSTITEQAVGTEPAASPTEQPSEPKPDYAAIARRALEARKADAKIRDRPVWFMDPVGNEYGEEAWVERLARDTEKPEKPEDVVELEAVGGPVDHRTYNWNLTWMPRIAVEHLDAKQFIHVLDAVHALVDEATLMFHPDGLQVRVMDPSHVAMAEVNLPASWFEEYSVEKPFKVGVNVAELMKRLPKVKSKDDRLRIETRLDARKVMWTVQTHSLKRGLTSLILSLGEEEIPKVNVPFTAEAYMTLDALATIIDDVARVSENVRLLANAADRTLTFEAPGYEGDYRTRLDRSQEDLLSLTAKEDAKTTVSLNYLTQIVKALKPLTETVYLNLANSMPLRVKADLNQAAIEFYIAPYIE